MQKASCHPVVCSLLSCGVYSAPIADIPRKDLPVTSAIYFIQRQLSGVDDTTVLRNGKFGGEKIQSEFIRSLTEIRALEIPGCYAVRTR